MSPLPRLIPCLDLADGRVVKGIRFERVEAVGDPVALAQEYERQGADEIVALDIAATPRGREANLEIVRAIADAVTIPLTVGGGVRSVSDATARLRRGADKLAINSAALRDPTLLRRVADEHGSQCVVAAVDVRVEGRGWTVVAEGGRRPTGREAVERCREAARDGAGELLVTAIDRDGTGTGYDLALYTAIRARVPLPIVASGGCGTAAHVVELFRSGSADAALLASRLHTGRLTVTEVQAAMSEAGVPIRREAAP